MKNPSPPSGEERSKLAPAPAAKEPGRWRRLFALKRSKSHTLPLAGRIARYHAARSWHPFAFLRAGFITGAADDDPSGIATYSEAGAAFGFSMCWVMLFTWPLMAAIQEISARIGRVTGEGIAGNIRAHYPKALLQAIVALLLLANILNLGADLGAMGSAVRLFLGGSSRVYVVLFAVLCAGLEVFSRYERYVRILKWTALSLFAYVAAVFAVKVPWGEVALSTFLPRFLWRSDYWVTIVGVLGTTISPYLFFWQSSEEVEDERISPDRHPLLAAPDEAPGELHRIRVDTLAGMGFSNLISLFIIITTAATLNRHGITVIETSTEAALALKPIAGPFAFAVFAAGIIGTGLLAIPVLAGSAAYALGEALGWPSGLSRPPRDAKAFYATIAIATLVGITFNFTDINPIRALFWCAVLNGVVAVPLMVVMMVMASDRKVMGDFTLPPLLKSVGWVSTVAMAAASAAMFATL